LSAECARVEAAAGGIALLRGWVRERVSHPAKGRAMERKPLLRFSLNFLNENGMFWCTLEHCFK